MFRALRVRKKMSGEKMPVKMIGDILTAQLPHMQPYIRFCSCQLNGAALIQQKTDEVPEFKEFVKVREEHSLCILYTINCIANFQNTVWNSAVWRIRMKGLKNEET